MDLKARLLRLPSSGKEKLSRLHEATNETKPNKKSALSVDAAQVGLAPPSHVTMPAPVRDRLLWIIVLIYTARIDMSSSPLVC